MILLTPCCVPNGDRMPGTPAGRQLGIVDRTMDRYFPEPDTPDDRPGLRDETLATFLKRSTWVRAAEIRAFYNENLAALPAPCGDRLCRRLASAHDSEAATFEMVVGRFLELRGASHLECEPGSGSRHVDWKAVYPDGVLHVEATVPLYNAHARVTVRRNNRMLGVIERHAPAGWWLLPSRLPALSENESLRPFERLVDGLLEQLPPSELADPETRITLAGRLPGAGRQELRITALRTRRARGGLGGGAMVAYWDNSETRVRTAWQDRRKRSQGRSVPAPALLALQGSFGGADLEAFEHGLFGRDVDRGRVPDGVMASDNDPPWSGVLAFPRVSPAGADDPVLFVNPRYVGSFPDAVARLEVRRLAERCVAIQAARDTSVMARMRWAWMDRGSN